MQRKVLVVGGAAGSGDYVGEAFARFGFGAPATVASLSDAPGALRAEQYDLVIVPLEHATAVELAAVEREIRRSGSTAVIGTAPTADPQMMLHAMRSGIQEFLVFPPDPKELNAALDRLTRRSGGEAKKGMGVAVYSAKGGLGTSTVALGLAHGFAKNNPSGRVAVADFVAGSGDLGVMLNLKPAYDIGDLVEKVDRIDEDLLYSLLTPATTGMWVLPASDRPEAAELLDGQAGTQIVSQLRAHFAFTVVDCEHHMSDRTLAALDAADRVLLVTQLNVAALRSTQRTIALCERLGYAPEKVCVVVNRQAPGDVVAPVDAAKVLDRELFWQLPNDYKTASGAITRGVPVGEYDAASKLAASYVSLAAKLGGTEAQNGNGRGGSSRLGRMLSFGRKG